jgi:integrase
MYKNSEVLTYEWIKTGGRSPEHIEEFLVGLNTGMRSKEQFVRLDWSCVDLVRKDIAVPQSKNGKGRHIPLNDAARAGFESMRQQSVGNGTVPIRASGPIFIGKGGERLLSARHWFPRAVKKAGITDFTWHDFAAYIRLAPGNG